MKTPIFFYFFFSPVIQNHVLSNTDIHVMERSNELGMQKTKSTHVKRLDLSLLHKSVV